MITIEKFKFKIDEPYALIVGSGSISDYDFFSSYVNRADFIICADGGARHMRKWGREPHILLGDFDSIEQKDMELFENSTTHIFRFPAQKDSTDTELALKKAFDSGFDNVIMLGCWGTRIDHSMGNLHLLSWAMLEKGKSVFLLNEHNIMFVINDKIRIKSNQDHAGFKVSLLPSGGAGNGVVTRGLYFPLNGETLDIFSTRGISNEMTEETAEISLQSGLLLVILSRDQENSLRS
ncbi:MAG: thiamine diphosphokinase [Clostridiales bacterium]|nr:thiamine diphosphokinase [Clostridiales bacterium]